MSNIDKQALREAAERATPGDWKYSTFDCAITDDTSSLAVVRMDSGHLNDEQSALNGAFIAAANPATVLALLDKLEAKDKYISELKSAVKSADDRYENRTPTQWAYDQACLALEKHRARAEAAEKRIAELEARDINVKQQAQALFEAIANPSDHYVPAYARCLREALNGTSTGKGESA
ncbi:MAG: ead/Ea22-like family protein [Enterobacter sp.]|nr:ead/Ea22-like family protein [Enterobacter sp.]MDU5501372.1 ead/Ea22-like family protein [Enterobacter sp.]